MFARKRNESFPTRANILSIVKHFSVKGSAVCLKQWPDQEWRYEQLFHSGSFPSFSSCKFSVWNADGKCYFVFVCSSSVVLILSEWYGKQYVT